MSPVGHSGHSGHSAQNVLVHFLFPFLSLSSSPLPFYTPLLPSSPLYPIIAIYSTWLYNLLSFLHRFRLFLSISPLNPFLLPEAFLLSGHNDVRYITDPWSWMVWVFINWSCFFIFQEDPETVKWLRDLYNWQMHLLTHQWLDQFEQLVKDAHLSICSFWQFVALVFRAVHMSDSNSFS